MSIILKPIQTLYDEIPCGGFGQHNLHNLYAKLSKNLQEHLPNISIYQFMQITNCSIDFTFILAVLKHKYLTITATKEAQRTCRVFRYHKRSLN